MTGADFFAFGVIALFAAVFMALSSPDTGLDGDSESEF